MVVNEMNNHVKGRSKKSGCLHPRHRIVAARLQEHLVKGRSKSAQACTLPVQHFLDSKRVAAYFLLEPRWRRSMAFKAILACLRDSSSS